ncbi:MAG: alpha-glucosidase [Bacilli bacterium]|nr:alpha-glucosidase [Bacilli bacterium]
MKITRIDNGIYGFSLLEKEFCLIFLSPSSFRVYEKGREESEAAAYEPVRENTLAFETPCGASFQYQGLEVLIESSGYLEAKEQSRSLVRALLYEIDRRERETTLAEKEGHASNAWDGGIFGLRLENLDPVYGLGEKTGPLDKRGYSYVNWNTDDPSAHVDTFPSLYQSIPFLISFRKNRSLGVFFDNTSKMRFDINKTEKDGVLLEYSGGFFDATFFFGSLHEVISSYVCLTGKQPLVPYWALGAQQSRWSYADKESAEAVVRGYETAGIPLSALYLDIDYMDAYKDFTVAEERFPEISSWLASLKRKSIHVVPIIDAGVKAEEGYAIYDEGVEHGYFCTHNGAIYHNEVWPGDSVFPAFLDESVRQWWALHVKKMLELGFDGIWNDMNEPASFQGPLPLDVDMGRGTPHSLAHNVYGHNMCKAGAEGFASAKKRLFQVTRAGYAGIQKYSSTWTGDNQSIYDHLRLMLPELMNMSLSGQAYIGVDIGGFGGDTTPELLARWAMASILNPLYRNHSAFGTLSQEPYVLEGRYLDAYKKAVMLRYEILPTLYDELYFASEYGSIALRPLIYNYPDDENLLNENTEMMLGNDLLLSPSLWPNEKKRSCYFPEPFIHYPSLKEYGAGYHLIDVDLGDSPLFLRKEGIVFLSRKGNKETTMPSSLRVYWNGQDGKAVHYEDAGDGVEHLEGSYNLFSFAFIDGRAHVTYLHQGMPTKIQEVTFFNAKGEEKTFAFADLLD